MLQQIRRIFHTINTFFAFLVASIALVSSVAIAQPLVQEQRSLEEAVHNSSTLIERGEYLHAIELLNQALDSAASGEDRSDAYYVLADVNLELLKYRPSLAASRSFLFGYPDDPRGDEVRYIRGIAAYQLGRRDEANGAFREIAAHKGSKTPEAYYWIARMYADTNWLDSAQYYADQSLAAPPHEFTDDALYLSAWIREGDYEIDTAAALYRRILDDYPESDLALDAQFRLGIIEARRGYYESALTLLESLTPKTERQREELVFYLAEVHSALGNYQQAQEYYTQFLRDFPPGSRSRYARYGLGWSQLKLGRRDEALASFRQLKNGLDSIAAASLYQIAAIQTVKGDTTGALATLHELVYRLPYESFSDNASYQLGKMHYRRGAYDSARHYFMIPARQFPGSDIRVDAYYLLGESYSALNDFENAEYAFARTQKVGEENTGHPRALYREGVMLYNVGRFRSAIDRLRRYVSEYETEAEIDDATFWLGEALYQDRSYDEAERYFAAVLERYPNSRWREQAAYGLGWARFQQKDFDGAAKAFAEFLKRYPNSEDATEATIRLADSYRYLGQYDQSIKTYKLVGGAGAKGIRDEEARFRLAEAFLEMGNVQFAVSTFRDLIKAYPNSERVDAYAYNIGTIYYDQGSDSLSIVELKNFLRTYPNSDLAPQAHFTIGDAYYNLGEYDSAFANYNAILNKYPSSIILPDALDAVRFSLDAMGRGREAVGIIDNFMAANPDRIPADSLTFKKANILFDNGAYPEAMGIYEELMREFPESQIRPTALYQIGRGYEYQGVADSAILVYTQVNVRFPQSDAAASALLDMGELKLSSEEWEPAIHDFEQFALRFPESNRINQARYGIGQALLQTGDTAAAIVQFRTVIDSSDIDNDDDLFIDRSRIALATVLAEQGEQEEALELLASVVARRLDYTAAEALLIRGRLLLGANDLAGALAELQRLTTEFAEYYEYSEPGMLELGKVYEELTNIDAARETYRTLIDTTLDEELKAEAEERLKAL